MCQRRTLRSPSHSILSWMLQSLAMCAHARHANTCRSSRANPELASPRPLRSVSSPWAARPPPWCTCRSLPRRSTAHRTPSCNMLASSLNSKCVISLHHFRVARVHFVIPIHLDLVAFSCAMSQQSGATCLHDIVALACTVCLEGSLCCLRAGGTYFPDYITYFQNCTCFALLALRWYWHTLLADMMGAARRIQMCPPTPWRISYTEEPCTMQRALQVLLESTAMLSMQLPWCCKTCCNMLLQHAVAACCAPCLRSHVANTFLPCSCMMMHRPGVAVL
jgi:hypothetical protein